MATNLVEKNILTSGGGNLWLLPTANMPTTWEDDIPVDDDLNIDDPDAVQIGVTTGTVELSIDAPVQGIPVNELPGLIKPYLGDTKAMIKFNHVQCFQDEMLELLPSVTTTQNATRDKIYGAKRTVRSDVGCVFICEQDIGVFFFVLYKCFFAGPLIFTLGKNEYAKPAITATAIPVASRTKDDTLYQAYITTP